MPSDPTVKALIPPPWSCVWIFLIHLNVFKSQTRNFRPAMLYKSPSFCSNFCTGLLWPWRVFKHPKVDKSHTWKDLGLRFSRGKAKVSRILHERFLVIQKDFELNLRFILQYFFGFQCYSNASWKIEKLDSTNHWLNQHQGKHLHMM